MFPEPVYRHETILASGIPLGGLGTGSVEIRPDGRFHDWEIFNNYLWSGNSGDAPPEMWSEDAFFAVRVQPAGQPARVRLLYDDDKKSRATASWYEYAQIYNYPFLRHVSRISYASRHPFAYLQYADPAVPLDITLQAFTPFIPFNAQDSGLPLACFVFHVKNTGPAPCDASLMFSLRNCVGYDLDRLTLLHRVERSAGATSVILSAEDVDPARRTSGSMAITCLSPQATVLPAWTDGRGLTGFPNAAAPGLSKLFYPFRDRGELAGGEDLWCRSIVRRQLQEGPAVLHGDRQAGWRWRGALCQKATLAPGEETEIVFLMSWYFPNHYHYATGQRLGHAYENWFADAAEVARYGITHYPRLRDESTRFVDEFSQGSLDPWLTNSLNAQLTTFPQSFWWTKAGELAAWEGSACCQIIPNLHTVWSSFQPLLFFPELYLANKKQAAAFLRGGVDGDASDAGPFLDSEQQHRCGKDQSQQADLGGWFEKRYKKQGYTPKDFAAGRRPPGRGSFLFVASAVQLLRDYQWTGDRHLLEKVWPQVKESMARGIQADQNQDGLPDGAISFLTYDHWFLPATNCYRGTMYLAELAAAAELARLVGDAEAARQFATVLRQGAESFEKLYWNGTYYNLCHDFRRQVSDRGCLADQVSGHLYLRLCGLPPVHPAERVASALRAVFRHNRKPEEGLLNGADPDGRTDWTYFARYSERGDDEALAGQWVTPWTGTEYYVAALMIAEGLTPEGLAVARDVYDRHVDWGMLYNHMECGEHYFRALAAWALLPALQGLVYDAASGTLTFAPRVTPEKFDSILLLPGAWGRITQERSTRRQQNTLRIVSGTLRVRTLHLQPPPESMGQAIRGQITRDGGAVSAVCQQIDGRVTVQLENPVSLAAGTELVAVLTW